MSGLAPIADCPKCEASGVLPPRAIPGAICELCLGSGKLVCPHCQKILAEALREIGACDITESDIPY